jgi:hypothetical protein
MTDKEKEVSMSDLQIDQLPEAAKKELAIFHEYLVFKYLKNIDTTKKPGNETARNLAAFYRLKKLRKKINPVVDKSIDIDKLCNEVNRDIF